MLFALFLRRTVLKDGPMGGRLTASRRHSMPTAHKKWPKLW